MLFATLALYIGCMKNNKNEIEVPATNNNLKSNSQAQGNSNFQTSEDYKNITENKNSQTLENAKVNVEKGENSQTSENAKVNIVEIPANNEKTYNGTSNILLSLSSIFLVLTVIFAIICIKHQQNRKNKTSK